MIKKFTLILTFIFACGSTDHVQAGMPTIAQIKTFLVKNRYKIGAASLAAGIGVGGYLWYKNVFKRARNSISKEEIIQNNFIMATNNNTTFEKNIIEDSNQYKESTAEQKIITTSVKVNTTTTSSEDTHEKKIIIDKKIKPGAKEQKEFDRQELEQVKNLLDYITSTFYEETETIAKKEDTKVTNTKIITKQDNTTYTDTANNTDKKDDKVVTNQNVITISSSNQKSKNNNSVTSIQSKNTDQDKIVLDEKTSLKNPKEEEKIDQQLIDFINYTWEDNPTKQATTQSSEQNSIKNDGKPKINAKKQKRLDKELVELSFTNKFQHTKIRDLLNRGANINTRSYCDASSTAYNFISFNENLNIVQLFVDHEKFNPNEKSPIDWPLLCSCLNNSHIKQSKTYKEKSLKIKMLLGHPKINPNLKTSYGGSPLSLAISYWPINEVQLLLNHDKTNPDLHTSTQTTPLMIAADKKNLDAFKAILKAGADINKTDFLNWTIYQQLQNVIPSTQAEQDMLDYLKPFAQFDKFTNNKDREAFFFNNQIPLEERQAVFEGFLAKSLRQAKGPDLLWLIKLHKDYMKSVYFRSCTRKKDYLTLTENCNPIKMAHLKRLVALSNHSIECDLSFNYLSFNYPKSPIF